MKIKIRKAIREDIPAIVRLIRELAEAGGETSLIHAAYVLEYLASPYSNVLIAEDERGIVGLLSYSVRPDLYHAGHCCMVEELVVSGDKRGHGIGGELLERHLRV